MGEFSEATLAQFLSVFRPAPQGMWPDTIAERTGLSREEIDGLRAYVVDKGFRFEDDAEGRWNLVDAPDVLHPWWVRAGLKCDRLASQIWFQPEVDSTQDIAFELMVEDRPHGTLVLTDHQRAGRGRGEATWHSTPGKSLQFSLLLDLDPPDTFASVLTIAIASSVARAIQDIAGLPARIKFPNDILVRGLKVAGILLEVRDYGGPTRRAVCGIGINCNQLREELPPDVREVATSLREEHRDKEEIYRPRLLRYILQELEKWLDRISQRDFDDLENAWNRFAAMEGREVVFRKGGERGAGRIVDARIREGLLIRTPDGKEERVRLEHLTDLRFVD